MKFYSIESNYGSSWADGVGKPTPIYLGDHGNFSFGMTIEETYELIRKLEDAIASHRKAEADARLKPISSLPANTLFNATSRHGKKTTTGPYLWDGKTVIDLRPESREYDFNGPADGTFSGFDITVIRTI